MSDLILNIRFGHTHLKWRKGEYYPYLSPNQYWVRNKPKPWFFVYQIGNLSFGHD